MTEERLIELYRANDPWMRRLAEKHTKCPDATGDIVTRIWANVIKGQIVERQERSIKVLLYCCVMNAVKNYIRDQKNKLKYLSLIEQSIDASVEPGIRFDGEAMRNLRRLPAAQRQAIELIVLQGYRAVDAAKELQISVDTLRMRLHRGLSWLRKMVVV